MSKTALATTVMVSQWNSKPTNILASPQTSKSVKRLAWPPLMATVRPWSTNTVANGLASLTVLDGWQITQTRTRRVISSLWNRSGGSLSNSMTRASSTVASVSFPTQPPPEPPSPPLKPEKTTRCEPIPPSLSSFALSPKVRRKLHVTLWHGQQLHGPSLPTKPCV